MQLFFRKYGEGQPIIILHGLFGSSDNWNTLAKKFSEHSLQVYIVDLRNHGLSPHSDEMNYILMANDVFELLQKESIHQPIILGHSMGGKVTMMMDKLFPDTLKKIIVADISPQKYPPGHTEVFNALNAVDFNQIKMRKDAEQILRNYLKDEAVIQFLLKNIFWETPEKLNWRFNLSAIQKHYDEILESIPLFVSQTPALFLRGEKSNYITDSSIGIIHQYYPDAKVVTISNAGHWIHAEQPQLFMESVFDFIKH
ncbi:MAG: alpha/beta fold hydrolase [Bacteroidota bacterium]